MTNSSSAPESVVDRPRPRVVVTGASSGIGLACAEELVRLGWSVVGVARRADRLAQLAERTGCEVFACDLTNSSEVAELVKQVGACDALVNVAGGAFGVDSVATGDVADWQYMFDINVVATLRVTQALLPALVSSGRGDVLVLTSTAALAAYEGGGGYCAAKAAEQALAQTLRLELAGQPVRVTQIAPGMVQTEEFSLNRLGGDKSRADAVYAGVDRPLTAQDVADCVGWVLTRPHHVNIDLLVVRPIAQAANHKVVRTPS